MKGRRKCVHLLFVSPSLHPFSLSYFSGGEVWKTNLETTCGGRERQYRGEQPCSCTDNNERSPHLVQYHIIS